jgi:hypothetical protein
MTQDPVLPLTSGKKSVPITNVSALSLMGFCVLILTEQIAYANNELLNGTQLHRVS